MSNPDSLTKWNEAQDNLSSITDKNEIWRIENIWKEVLKNAEKMTKWSDILRENLWMNLIISSHNVLM